MYTLGDYAMATIPESHKDLLEEPNAVTLATVNTDGTPQTTVLWFIWDGEKVVMSTTRGRQKTENIEANPDVSLMIIDPENMYRYLELRGTVEITEEGAYDLIDKLAQRYTGKATYYGNVAPAENKGKEDRVILNVVPKHVVVNG